MRLEELTGGMRPVVAARTEFGRYRNAAAIVLILAALVALSSLGYGGLRASAANYGYGYGYEYTPPVFLVGNEALQPAVDQTIAGRGEAFVYTAAKTGSVTEMRVYLDATSEATKLVVGLYTATGNRPGTLLTQGSKTGVVNGAWNTVTVPAATVTVGAQYWLAVLSPFGFGKIAIRDHCCAVSSAPPNSVSETSRSSELTVLPTTWLRGTRFPKDGPASLAAYGQSP